MTDRTVVVFKLYTEQQVLKIPLPMFGTKIAAEVWDARLVENNVLKIQIFKERLPFPTDTRIASSGIWL